MTRITTVRAKALSAEIVKGIRPDASDAVTVKIGTDDGITGLSYISYRHNTFGGYIASIVQDVLAKYLIGKDPTAIEEIWEDLNKRTTRPGRRGVILHAIGVIDNALWDILGKLSNKPVWRLIGGYRSNVPIYVNASRPSIADLAKKAKDVVEEGFKAVKISVGTVGDTTRIEGSATERIAKVREAIGQDTNLMVDIHSIYDKTTALRMAKRWEKYELFWMEEPIHTDDLEGYRRLKKACPVPIAMGEDLAQAVDFKLWLENDACDYIQPDVALVGGITPWLHIWSIANVYGVPCAPHATPLLDIHLAAGKPNTFMLDYLPVDSGSPTPHIPYSVFNISESIRHPKAGFIQAPEEPGLGFSLKKEYEF